LEAVIAIAGKPLAEPSAGHSAAALAAFDLTKSFGATHALRGATLDLVGGEVHALLGENGSGKSTFAKILAGIHRADRGRVERDGHVVQIADPAAARNLGIGIVFQELSLAPHLSVIDNMFLGREVVDGLTGWVDSNRESKACREMLDRLGVTVDPGSEVRQLGMAQKQMIEIGKALLLEPAVLIFDEPTASLTEREIAQLFQVIGQLRRAGKAVLYVTHHLREVLEIADRVSVMRDGKIVATQPVTEQTTETGLIALLTEKRLQKPELPMRATGFDGLLRVNGFRSVVCDNVSFHVGPGEIVGLYGVVGCGREEISRSLVGLHRPLEGDVILSGRAFQPHNPADALARGVGFLASDRKQDGILPNRPIRENLTLSRLNTLSRRGFLRARDEETTTKAELQALRVKYASAEDYIVSLSGGNQQKVLFGRALGAAQKLLVLEDATAGIDIGSKYDLYELIRRSAETGTSLLWLSSDMLETLTLCHRVYAMYGGRIVAEIVAPTLADEERLLAAVLGRTNEVAQS
jgi:ribose transport system ATP-binding protein